MSIQCVDRCSLATVEAAPLPVHLGHPAPDQQVASLIPLTRHRPWVETRLVAGLGPDLLFILSMVGGHVHIVGIP
jgi:hypothetical protein